MKLSSTGIYSILNRGSTVILPFPLLPIQGRIAEDTIDALRIISGSESNQRTECGIRFRL